MGEDLLGRPELDKSADKSGAVAVRLGGEEAVESAMRRASRRLWVTITIVTSGVISRIRSSMREVLIGSSADAGSSISRMSGSIARARAITRRCC